MSVLEQIANFGDVLVTVDVELDRRVISMRDVLQLEVGSVIKMSRSAGENMDVLVGGTLVGFGEIVIIEDSVGIRITDFSSEE
jgi:flagellar motor switch protein FliN/FliY